VDHNAVQALTNGLPFEGDEAHHMRGEIAIPIDDDDTSSSEGRFGQRDVKKYSGWASAAAIAVKIIIVGLVFYFRVKLTGL
jgi:hypothetical protein